MKTKTNLWPAIWLLISLSACQSKPEFINHAPPNLAVSMDVFSNDSLLANFGCHEIQAPPSLIGGLEPSYPIAICAIQSIPGEGREELAAENLSAYYGLHYDPAYEYEVDTIEDTYVIPETDGYLVHLFHDQAFGCGPHWISEVDVHASVEGNIEERRSRQSFRDPDLDELCVD